MKTTPLSFLLDNMDVHKDIANLEIGLKVRAIDAQIRELRQGTNFPWNLVKGTLRVFDGVYEYPITVDHDELAYIDKQNLSSYEDTARFYNTSLQQFYEDVNQGRNLLADIWKDGVRMIGIKEKNLGLGSSQLSGAEDITEYTCSDDASNPALDEITYKSGYSSIRFSIDNSTGSATIVNTIDTLSDANYQKKYVFREIYLDAIPTSIEMQLRTDASNHLSAVVTTQFSGENFKADDWNLIAFDLNEATETGTFNSASITAEAIIINGAATGTYRLGQSFLREWLLLDKWYYSLYNVSTSSALVANKEFFIGTSESTADIDTTDKLVGENKWFDVVLYGAIERLMAEIENTTLFSYISRKNKEAKQAFSAQYPSMRPLITTSRRNFNNDPSNVWLN